MSLRRISLDVNIVSVLIVVVCLAGCATSSWFLGRREGIEATIEHFATEGYIDLVEEDSQDK